MHNTAPALQTWRGNRIISAVWPNKKERNEEKSPLCWTRITLILQENTHISRSLTYCVCLTRYTKRHSRGSFEPHQIDRQRHPAGTVGKLVSQWVYLQLATSLTWDHDLIPPDDSYDVLILKFIPEKGLKKGLWNIQSGNEKPQLKRCPHLIYSYQWHAPAWH